MNGGTIAKLSMPALAIGGEKANGQLLGQQLKVVAADGAVVVLKDTGHWVLEENPKETTDALMKIPVKFERHRRNHGEDACCTSHSAKWPI